MKVPIWSGEEYPVYRIDDEYAWCDLNDVDPAIVAGWQEAQNAFDTMQREIRDLIERPCDNCGHPKLRHQVVKEVPYSPQSQQPMRAGYHGCLAQIEDEGSESGSRRCRCTDWTGPEAPYTRRDA